MDAGIYRTDNDAYHSGPGISKSGLDLIRKSPAHYRAVVTAANDNRPPPTPAQVLGTAFHTIVLEPGEFIRRYTLALRRSDVPNAIDDREVLVAMVQKLNEGRAAKLVTGGTKAEQVERILAAEAEMFVESVRASREELEGMKGAELKSYLDKLNSHRPGLLGTSGSRHELADILRAHGVEVTLWSDVQAEWLKNNGHRIVLTEEQWNQLHNMRDAVMAHPAAAKLLSAPGEAELSAYWVQRVIDPATGDVVGEQLCRVRPDYWRRDGILIDLKSCEDASEEEFARSIDKWSYHVQDDFYRHGVAEALRQGGMRIGDVNAATGEITYRDDDPAFAPPRAFVFIACEKTACVVDGKAKGVAVYSLDDESRALGRWQWQTDLARYSKCAQAEEWPGYADSIRQIKLPAWRVTRVLQQQKTATAE